MIISIISIIGIISCTSMMYHDCWHTPEVTSKKQQQKNSFHHASTKFIQIPSRQQTLTVWKSTSQELGF